MFIHESDERAPEDMINKPQESQTNMKKSKLKVRENVHCMLEELISFNNRKHFTDTHTLYYITTLYFTCQANE